MKTVNVGGISISKPEDAADRRQLEALRRKGKLDPGHEYRDPERRPDMREIGVSGTPIIAGQIHEASEVAAFGGSGSGDFGHSGRKGEVGGSGSGGASEVAGRGPLGASVLEGIRARAEAFYRAGGTVVSFNADEYRSNPKLQALTGMATAKQEAIQHSTGFQGPMFMAAALTMEKGSETDHCIVALSPRGDPVAAVGYNELEYGKTHVGNIGSSLEMRGAGTAVELELARQSPGGVVSQYTPKSKGFHAAMGRTLTPDAVDSGGWSKWSAAATAQLAALQIDGKLAAAEDDEIDYEPHDSDELAATFEKLRADGILNGEVQ